MSSKLHGLVQTEWRWLIAIYLFLAGAGGGAHITAVFADFMGWEKVANIGVCLGWPLVLIGCMCLLGDLGNVVNAWRVARKPNTSWIAASRPQIVPLNPSAATRMVPNTSRSSQNAWRSSRNARTLGRSRKW